MAKPRKADSRCRNGRNFNLRPLDFFGPFGLSHFRRGEAMVKPNSSRIFEAPVWGQPAVIPQRYRNVTPSTHRYVSQRLSLSYVTWGTPDRPPLFLIHGGRDNARSWDWIAAALCEKWYVIAPDLRGHGDSAWSPDGDYTASAYVYDLAQLMHQLNVDSITIVAHSMGAHLAIRLSGVYPEKVAKVVAIEGFGFGPENSAAFPPEQIGERLRNWIEQKRGLSMRFPKRYPSLAAARARILTEHTYLADHQASHLTKHGVNQNEDGTFTWKFDHYVNLWDHIDIKPAEWIQLCSNVLCPVLLIYGSDSWVDQSTDNRIEGLPNAASVEISSAGHWPHHQRLDETLRLIRHFIE